MQKFSLFAGCLVLLLVKSAVSSRNTTVPALIVFGDSIVDAGNNNNLRTIAKCNYPPYGRDFYGQEATGRFSNGKIINDIIVSEIGIKDSDLLTGVTFASGAAGLDNLTSELAPALSMATQLELFKEYKVKLVAFAGQERANYIISRAQYLLVNGNNDIWNTCLFTGFRKSQYDLPSYADFLVAAASHFTKELYAQGGRRILIVGLLPLGCVPDVRTLLGGIGRECVESYNQASLVYDNKLQQEILTLNQTLDGSVIAYQDVYYRSLDIILNPSKYGFIEATKGCCGSGELEVSFLCNSMTPYTCPDALKYVFWDNFHPTERAYCILVDEFINDFL